MLLQSILLRNGLTDLASMLVCGKCFVVSRVEQVAPYL